MNSMITSPLYAFPPATPRNTTDFLIESSQQRDMLLDQLAGMMELGLTNAYGSMSELMDKDTASACRMDRSIETADLHRFLPLIN